MSYMGKMKNAKNVWLITFGLNTPPVHHRLHLFLGPVSVINKSLAGPT